MSAEQQKAIKENTAKIIATLRAHTDTEAALMAMLGILGQICTDINRIADALEISKLGAPLTLTTEQRKQILKIIGDERL